MHTGATIVAFRAREPERVLVPWADEKLLDATMEELDSYPGFAEWWREAERVWNRHRSRSSKLTLRDRLDFQRGLRLQFPIPKHRVVYAASGQHLAACRLEDASAVIEHKLYWAACSSIDEARYLTSILNSRTLAEATTPLQSRGQHNPRDFDTHVFAMPFPAFDSDDELHQQLVQLAVHAEEVAIGVELDPAWQFQRARRVTREALAEDGTMADIDALVIELLAA
jgi:hypothetical protein